jgi:hypothetical protein
VGTGTGIPHPGGFTVSDFWRRAEKQGVEKQKQKFLARRRKMPSDGYEERY